MLEDALRSRLPYITDRPTIIFGADVTHPPPGEDSSASIAAVRFFFCLTSFLILYLVLCLYYYGPFQFVAVYPAFIDYIIHQI